MGTKNKSSFSSKRIKLLFSSALLLLSTGSFAQSKAESKVLQLSKDLFRWEVEGKIDSVSQLFDEKLIVIGSKGNKRGKNEYLTDLKNGKPIHNSIDVQESSSTVTGSTAIVVGKGVFVTTVNAVQATSHLSYMEVFVKEARGWKLIALYANRLPE